ncbi:sperm acrosome membrane-associated protein 6 isoform X2 [Nerophis lumbriciformis]|uniref:sperm acrosome membrane-associated protein 6 isoform X2 n=1 Tax=Nerophis lumbriciformis TaxID=546530 RepID=UPI002ADFCEF4|nr:sperm acrosome associated 6 isoform X2 [Nerophis lumbriciformis]
MYSPLALWLLCVGVVFRESLGCITCLVDVNQRTRLCWGYTISENKVQSMDACFNTLKRLFDDNTQVLQAGRVGKAYGKKLADIMKAEIQLLVDEFDKKQNPDTGCVPPCGFQVEGAIYSCISCKYDSCAFPLDCPAENMTVTENNKTQMLCKVSFPLPSSIGIVWRFAEQVKTQEVDQFREMTMGEDNLYSIPSTRKYHQGTYQCEIYSEKTSIVRLYFYLTVTPHVVVVVGHSRLQEIFELSLLPGGKLHTGAPLPSQQHLVLIAICFTSLLLLLILSLGTLFLLSQAEKTTVPERISGIEDLGS